ncbi:MAG: hypothetical protein K8T89_08725 [Planctomycetes bacterium]|nr:hypothetical protein [Planctomycetota bacterium]
MNQLLPSQIPAFMKRFRFQGGALHRFRIANLSVRQAKAEVIVRIREGANDQRVRLRLVFDGVEEYRFQRRPGPALVRLKEVHLAAFNGVIYLNLDPFADDTPPAVIDFRASDAFLAARSVSWEILPARKAPAKD